MLNCGWLFKSASRRHRNSRLSFEVSDIGHFCGHHSQKQVETLESAAAFELFRFECVTPVAEIVY